MSNKIGQKSSIQVAHSFFQAFNLIWVLKLTNILIVQELESLLIKCLSPLVTLCSLMNNQDELLLRLHSSVFSFLFYSQRIRFNVSEKKNQ